MHICLMMVARYNTSLALLHVGWSILKRRLATDCVLQKDLDRYSNRAVTCLNGYTLTIIAWRLIMQCYCSCESIDPSV